MVASQGFMAGPGGFSSNLAVEVRQDRLFSDFVCGSFSRQAGFGTYSRWVRLDTILK